VHHWQLAPVPDAESHLRLLLDRYWQGLSEPLPFFPATSFAWTKAQHRGKDPHEAARQKWEPGFNSSGEGSEPAYRLCFPQDRFAASQAFAELAALFIPILEDLEDDHAAA
jgi:exodeoxyribonuclease V gamma subunit